MVDAQGRTDRLDVWGRTGLAFSIGVDYGTESGRVLVLDLTTGDEVAVHVVPYAHGVVDQTLPGRDERLLVDWALQHPADYLEVLTTGIPAVLHASGVRAQDVIGLGIDFTSCTVLPALADGTPLCMTEAWRSRPHAWPKLWKHHAAQRFADRINTVASTQQAAFLSRYGGRISSEWYFPKLLEMVAEDREVYEATAAFVEATDWVVWQLTGSLVRNSCTAGYKAMRDDDGTFPDVSFFTDVYPAFDDPTRVLGQAFSPVGTRAGMLTADWADRLGLSTRVAIAVGNVDAHVSVPGAGVSSPGAFVMVIGTSICHLNVTRERVMVPGITGVVKDGVLPGYYGYESGQAAVGDMLAWFVHQAVNQPYILEAEASGRSVYEVLEQHAGALAVGESGLVAIDWWNGNRSVLGDADLSGVILGLTLGTQGHHIYRALLESIAFGTRRILDNFGAAGITFHELVACGGLAHKSPLLMQIYADVCGVEVTVRASQEIPARGAALFGAVAAGKQAGGFDGIEEASQALSPPTSVRYIPDTQRQAVYGQLYPVYRTFYDYLGTERVDLLHGLKHLRQAASGGGIRHA